MGLPKKISTSFNDLAKRFRAATRAPTALEERLQGRYGVDAARDIVTALNHLQIPLPEKSDAVLYGNAGLMLFSEVHGVIIRIETDKKWSYGNSVYVNDSPWMLQPLGAIQAGGLNIEIMPGVHAEKSDAESRKLYWKLWGEGYHYWDERIDNAGRLPATPEFPDGATVIVDRLSARKLSDSTAPVKRALKILEGEGGSRSFRSPLTDPVIVLNDVRAEFSALVHELTGQGPPKSIAGIKLPAPDDWPPDVQFAPLQSPFVEALKIAIERLTQDKISGEKHSPYAGMKDPQEVLYGPLRACFAEAWPQGAEAPDPEKISSFWQQVLAAKNDGLLVNGWEEFSEQDARNLHKVSFVQRAAKSFSEDAKKIGTPYELSHGVSGGLGERIVSAVGNMANKWGGF